jgi:HK97 family phage major capsid protein
MANYSDRIDRTGSSRTARQLPETVAQEVLADVYEGSAALQLGRVQKLTAYQHRIPVLSAFANAYWQQGATQSDKDSALKQTSKLEWDNVYITPDELAVLVPVPDAWVADSNISFEEVKTEIQRAFAKAIDQAIFFGDGSPPAGFSGPVGGLVGGAVSAGNFTTLGTTTAGAINDIALDLANVAEDLANDGYDSTGWAAKRGFHWRLNKMRSTTGESVYTPPSSEGPGTIYSEPFYSIGNGAWDNTEALAITGEWDKLRIGVRQDITFTVHADGVITDGSGNVIYNAMQEDGKVLRCVMRLGYAVN